MARILVVYGTTEGHTAEIADRMVAVMRGKGHDVEVHEANEVRKRTLSGDYDGAILGGSVHAGEYQSSLREFVKRNRELLARVPSAFFSVSLAAADSDQEAIDEIQSELDKFSSETGWHPQRIEKIAGALAYTQYNFFIRHMMKLIAKNHGRVELDTSRDFDFTDWAAVERFAGDFTDSVTLEVKSAAR